MVCNGRTFQELPSWLKLPCKSGLQWAAMRGLFRNYPPPPPDWNCHVRVGCNELQWEEFSEITPLDWNCHVRVGCNELQWEDFSGITPPDWNCHVRVGCNELQWEEFSEITPLDWNCHIRVGCNGLKWKDFSGITPLTKIAMYEWAAMGCNGSTFEDLPPPPPDRNCHVRVGCSGLQWEDFSGITLPPWLKLPCKSGLQWAAMEGLFRNYPPPPDWNCHVRVGCNGLQWEDFSGITPLDWNCHFRVGCNGLQWEDFAGITSWLKLPCKSGLQWAAMGGLFRNYPPLTEIAM